MDALISTSNSLSRVEPERGRGRVSGVLSAVGPSKETHPATSGWEGCWHRHLQGEVWMTPSEWEFSQCQVRLPCHMAIEVPCRPQDWGR